jgi:hypothetical protein
MSSIEVYVRTDVDIDDIVDAMSDKEKRELYEVLADELSDKPAIEVDENNDIADYLRDMTPYELKKVLCNVLGIPSYVDTEALRAKLEPVITA